MFEVILEVFGERERERQRQRDAESEFLNPGDIRNEHLQLEYLLILFFPISDGL